MSEDPARPRRTSRPWNLEIAKDEAMNRRRKDRDEMIPKDQC